MHKVSMPCYQMTESMKFNFISLQSFYSSFRESQSQFNISRLLSLLKELCFLSRKKSISLSLRLLVFVFLVIHPEAADAFEKEKAEQNFVKFTQRK